MYEVKLPQIADKDTESMIVFWYKSEGDEVKKGQILVEVQTEKATTEIEAEEDGILQKILVDRGETAKAGDLLAQIKPLSEVATQKETAPSGLLSEKERNAEPGTFDESSQFVRVSPRLRKLAKELGVKLEEISGTGKDGRITEADIRKKASNEVADYQDIPFAGVRQTIAKKMMNSLQSSAQLTETAWADVTALDDVRKRSQKPFSWNELILFSVILALKQHPALNAHVFDDKIRQYVSVHLGVAVNGKSGLFVPVIRNADALSLTELKDKTAGLIEKARKNRLTADELSGSTFTVTNLGPFGIQFFTPILNQPEAAILGTGKIETDLVLQNGQVKERKRLPLSLTFDHRAVDGAPAATFLQTVIQNLQEPALFFEKSLANE